MIQYKTGDLLSVTSGVIIHGCNAQGVMGSGVALLIKQKYPKAYQVYKDFEAKHGLRLSSISQIRIPNSQLYIANMITQELYGTDPKVQYASYGAIHLGFEKLNAAHVPDIPFHFPKIGAGRGNGDWNVISSLIELACPNRELICWTL